MNYINILKDYSLLVDKLINIHNLTSNQTVINDNGIAKIVPSNLLITKSYLRFAITKKKEVLF